MDGLEAAETHLRPLRRADRVPDGAFRPGDAAARQGARGLRLRAEAVPRREPPGRDRPRPAPLPDRSAPARARAHLRDDPRQHLRGRDRDRRRRPRAVHERRRRAAAGWRRGGAEGRPLAGGAQADGRGGPAPQERLVARVWRLARR